MKRKMAVLLSVCLLMGLCGCGSADTENSQTGASVDTAVSEETTSAETETANTEVTEIETEETEDTESTDLSQIPTDHVIYLTFDDGPGKYTEQLLDLLDKYDIKATFFVTNAYPGYSDMIAEEYARGHSIGIHTYSHDYSVVYASEDAYYEDLYAMQDIVYEQTGTRPNLIRFPGGSSNSVSHNYCKGIMTTLVSSTAEKGFWYTDWNVDSGDGETVTNEDMLYEKTVEGLTLHANESSVVLMHDVKQTTVNGVEAVIIWALDNGYTFLPLTDPSQAYHHSSLNN